MSIAKTTTQVGASTVTLDSDRNCVRVTSQSGGFIETQSVEAVLAFGLLLELQSMGRDTAWLETIGRNTR